MLSHSTRKVAAALALLVAGALAAGFAAARAESAPTILTTTYVFSTATNSINGVSPNQGWWSATVSNTNSNSNTNYITGTSAAGNLDRGFFTFDITGISSPCTPVDAYLDVPRATGEGAGPHLLGLYDVQTGPVTLNNKANNPNVAIYNDLGSGVNYGTYSLPTAGGPISSFI